MLRYPAYVRIGSRVRSVAAFRRRHDVKPFPRAVLASTLLIGLVACAGGGSTVNVTGVVVTPAAPAVDLGATVALTAGVQPATAGQAVTWSSSDEGVATVSASGVVTGYGLGTAVITATSVVDDDFSDAVTVSVACGTLLAVSEDIDVDTALPLDCYLLTRAVHVSARLSLAAGSIVYAGTNGGLRIAPGGSLRAEGTALHPITFTSESGERDDWYGVGIFSDSDDNVLDHVRMENAGNTFGSVNGMQPTNLYVGAVTPDPLEYGRVAITNSSFGDAGKLAGDSTPGTGTGLYVGWAENVLATFEGNTFDGNGRAAIRMTSHQLGSIGAGNVFGVGAAPGAAFIEVARDGDLTSSATWRVVDVPYRFAQAHVLNDAGAVISIDPGAVFEFETQAGLRVGAGALRAIGTAAAPITFTSASGERGDWYGVGIFSDSDRNALDHVLMEKAGTTSGTVNAMQPSNLYVAATGVVAVTNSAFNDATHPVETQPAWGIFIADGGEVTDAAGAGIDPASDGGNTFSGNKTAPVGRP